MIKNSERLQNVDRILSVAQGLIQERGYNGFSFRDIAAEIGIKSASIHYHFPKKSDLARTVAANYRTAFSELANAIASRNLSTDQSLRAYSELFQKTLKTDNRLCLCGMLASESNSLNDNVLEEVSGFFSDQTEWLTRCIQRGREQGEIARSIDPARISMTLMAALEGGMIMARANRRTSDLARITDDMIDLISARRN